MYFNKETLSKGGKKRKARLLIELDLINPDNPLGREMMVGQVARQFFQLGEVHGVLYGRRTSSENGRKLTTSNRAGSKSLPMH